MLHKLNSLWENRLTPSDLADGKEIGFLLATEKLLLESANYGDTSLGS